MKRLPIRFEIEVLGRHGIGEWDGGEMCYLKEAEYLDDRAQRVTEYEIATIALEASKNISILWNIPNREWACSWYEERCLGGFVDLVFDRCTGPDFCSCIFEAVWGLYVNRGEV